MLSRPHLTNPNDTNRFSSSAVPIALRDPRKTVGVLPWHPPINGVSSRTSPPKCALCKRGSKFYTHSSTMCYVDFCIALLRARVYSLNHETVPAIPPKAFMAAWRAMNVIADTWNDSVAHWIRLHYTNRTSAGYCVALNMDMPYNLHPVPLSPISESNSTFRRKCENDRQEEFLVFLESILDKTNIFQIQRFIRNMQEIPAFYSSIIPSTPQAVTVITSRFRTIFSHATQTANATFQLLHELEAFSTQLDAFERLLNNKTVVTSDRHHRRTQSSIFGFSFLVI